MAQWSDPKANAIPRAATTAVGEAAFDRGLRSYMLSVYNTMASGVLLTGIVALLFASGGATSLAAQLFSQGGPLKWIVMLAPLAVVMVLSFRANTLSLGAAKGLYWAFAVLMGLSLSTIFLVYTGTSIAQTFFATAAAFAGLSLFGYTTKRNLSAIGTFLIMGVVGLLGCQGGNPPRRCFAIRYSRLSHRRCRACEGYAGRRVPVASERA